MSSYFAGRCRVLMSRGVHVSNTSESSLGVWTDVSSAILRLGQSLFPLFALALDLPENFFDDKVSRDGLRIRL